AGRTGCRGSRSAPCRASIRAARPPGPRGAERLALRQWGHIRRQLSSQLLGLPDRRGAPKRGVGTLAPAPRAGVSPRSGTGRLRAGRLPSGHVPADPSLRRARRPGGGPVSRSVLRTPGLPLVLAMTFLSFSGYAALLPVAPLWVVHGGAGSVGAGMVNGVLMLFTVLTQLLIPTALRRFGWAPVLIAGTLLLGLPSVAFALSDALAPVLALSAVRGLGFGVVTVTGSALVAEFVEPERRGEAIGLYGLAIAAP